MIGSTSNIKGALPSCQKSKEDMEDNGRDSIHKRNKLIKIFLGILIWILVCVPSNIVATIFYFKQNEVVTGAMAGPANMFINTNVTTRDDDEETRTKLNKSATIINQVSIS